MIKLKISFTRTNAPDYDAALALFEEQLVALLKEADESLCSKSYTESMTTEDLKDVKFQMRSYCYQVWNDLRLITVCKVNDVSQKLGGPLIIKDEMRLFFNAWEEQIAFLKSVGYSPLALSRRLISDELTHSKFYKIVLDYGANNLSELIDLRRDAGAAPNALGSPPSIE